MGCVKLGGMLEQDINDALDEVLSNDAELFRDFCDAFDDHAKEIELLISRLQLTPGDTALIGELFRAFHNIKGDAAMCRLSCFVDIVHSVETLLVRLRNGELAFTESFGQVLLLMVDRLELVLEGRRKGERDGTTALIAVWKGVDSLGALPPSGVNAGFSRLIDVMSGLAVGEALPASRERWLPADATLARQLSYFRELALQLEGHSALFQGRTERNLRLALETNRLAGSWVDPLQLEAAVYIHDVGMMFLPASLWLSEVPLDDAGRRKLQTHPALAAEWLDNIPGWGAAAQMVLQHHEKPDGSGYPGGLKGPEIVPGAKILSLVDTFEAVMLKQLKRGHPRSLLRAAAEVNASDLQFDKAWVEPFNRAVQLVREGG